MCLVWVILEQDQTPTLIGGSGGEGTGMKCGVQMSPVILKMQKLRAQRDTENVSPLEFAEIFFQLLSFSQNEERSC